MKHRVNAKGRSECRAEDRGCSVEGKVSVMWRAG